MHTHIGRFGQWLARDLAPLFPVILLLALSSFVSGCVIPRSAVLNYDPLPQQGGSQDRTALLPVTIEVDTNYLGVAALVLNRQYVKVAKELLPRTGMMVFDAKAPNVIKIKVTDRAYLKSLATAPFNDLAGLSGHPYRFTLDVEIIVSGPGLETRSGKYAVEAANWGEPIGRAPEGAKPFSQDKLSFFVMETALAQYARAHRTQP